ncbi:hypothetical protein JTB14_012551, partial [Gonioctena quinquepunctata]
NSILGINLNEQDSNNIFPLNPDAEAPIKLEFLSYLKKRKLFENVHKLKGSKITILNDMCYEDRNNYKILQQHIKEARSKQLSAKIKGLRLIVDGESYTAQQLIQKTPEPEEIFKRNESKSEPSSPKHTRDLYTENVKKENIPNLPATSQNEIKQTYDKSQKHVYNTRPRINSNTSLKK